MTAPADGLAANPTGCPAGRIGAPIVGPPSRSLAWRAAPTGAVGVFAGIPGDGGRRRAPLAAGEPDWLLVLGSARAPDGRCWVKVRLPGRPNAATGWVARRRVLLRPTPWRLEVWLGRPALAIARRGDRVAPCRVGGGAPTPPTPRGLFSIVNVWSGDPDAFTGSWVLGLTAHSDVLRHFEGGSGEVGIHGRGGSSLLDPLGSAASHGCIRMANRAIDQLVRIVGRRNLPGIPVYVRR
jgi:hypothetical protein